FDNHQLTGAVAINSILIAIIASLCAKISISWIVNRGAYSRAVTAVFLPLIAIVAAFTWIGL
ncbi:MAG: hypothetical protein ABL958_11320, partial [Bdellovibrionia bacterium]